MNFFKVFLRIKSLGILLTNIGELLVGLSEIRSRSNLDRGRTSSVDHEGMSQESINSNGVMDEEPATDEVGIPSGQSDLLETARPEGPLSRP